MASEHRRILQRLDALEARADRHEHAHDIAAHLRGAPEEKINARLDEIEAALGARLLASDVDDSAAHIELGSRFLRLSEKLERLERRAEHAHMRLDAQARILSRPKDTGLEERISALEAKAKPSDVISAEPHEPDGKWWVIAKRGSPPTIFTQYDGFIRWEESKEYVWREKWSAQDVCDRLFGSDDTVSVQESMRNA